MINQFGVQRVRNAKSFSGLTCLHRAALKQHSSIITLFSENGADLDPKDWAGATPLRMAIILREYSSITTLIKLGASLEKANGSDKFQRFFEASMKEEKTKAAIAKGQTLAGKLDDGNMQD